MTGDVSISWGHVEDLQRFVEAARKVTSQYQFMNASRRALNRTGDMANTRVVRALSKQTGLKQKILRRAVKKRRANYSELAYRLRSEGGDISLKFFKPRETRRGVSAAPFGERRVFRGTFMRAGRFPNRVDVPAFHDHTFRRTGSSRLPIVKVRSHVIIPQQMVQGKSADAFNAAVHTILPRRFAHEINRITDGAFG